MLRTPFTCALALAALTLLDATPGSAVEAHPVLSEAPMAPMIQLAAYTHKKRHRHTLARRAPVYRAPVYGYAPRPARPYGDPYDAPVGFRAPNVPDNLGNTECATQFGAASNGFVRDAVGRRMPCF